MHDPSDIIYELFYQKLKEIYKTELDHAHAGDKITEELFKFSKHRILEIEEEIHAHMRMEKLYEPSKCTRLDNVAASGSTLEM